MVTVAVLFSRGQRRSAENHDGAGQAECDRGYEQPAIGFGSPQDQSDLPPAHVQGTWLFRERAH